MTEKKHWFHWNVYCRYCDTDDSGIYQYTTKQYDKLNKYLIDDGDCRGYHELTLKPLNGDLLTALIELLSKDVISEYDLNI